MHPTLHHGGDTLSAGEVAALAASLAGALHQAGVAEGDVVAVLLRNEPIYAIALLACRMIGTHLCSINWHFKRDEAAFILADSRAKILLAHSDLLGPIEGAAPPSLPVVSVAPRPATCLAYRLPPGATAHRPGALALEAFLAGARPLEAPLAAPRLPMPYTSGTTGRPKGVVREPFGPQGPSFGGVLRQVYGINKGARCLLSAPMYHSAPLSYVTSCCLEGATLFLSPRFDAEETLATVERERISHLYLVPAMYQRLLRLPDTIKKRYDLSSVVHVGSTGSPCSPEVKRAMIDWWGPVITESYASSEAGYITFIDALEWLARPGSAGRPVGQARLVVVDEAKNPLPPGQVGLIYAQQPAYPDFTYANNHEARRAIDLDGMITLGDMGWLDDEGFLYVTDRKADMVISGGVNIYPAEIEAALAAMPGVADCAVFGIPDDEYGEALAAAVERSEPVSADEIAAYLRQRLAGYKVPRVIEFHDRLPREDTGKIFKKRLREPHWRGTGRAI